MVRDLEEIQQDVGDLIAYLLAHDGIGVRRDRLLRRHPLEDLGQLGRLHDERGAEVFGRVERLPITFGGEGAQRRLQGLDVQFGCPPLDSSGPQSLTKPGRRPLAGESRLQGECRELSP